VILKQGDLGVGKKQNWRKIFKTDLIFLPLNQGGCVPADGVFFYLIVEELPGDSKGSCGFRNLSPVLNKGIFDNILFMGRFFLAQILGGIF